VAYYLFNLVPEDAADGPTPRRLATECLRVRKWGIDVGEPLSHALAPGDVALIYLGASERLLIGRAELASAVHVWTPSEAQAYPGTSHSGVMLAEVEEWEPPVPMEIVLQRIDRSAGARADFQLGVVRITVNEYETALAVAGGM
jgi:hypothetical protein